MKHLFQKGHKHSESTKVKLSMSKMGDKNPMYGKKLPESLKENLRKINTGNKHCLGKKHTDEWKKQMGIRIKKEWVLGLRKTGVGENSPNWKGGISKIKKYNFCKYRYKARKRGAIGSHTEQQWFELKFKYGFMCLCCKKFEPEIKLTEDHIVPLSRGGSDYIGNIQPLCQRCNSIKHTKVINFINNKLVIKI